ncbi:MAG: hypothetical protein ACYSSL_00400 [Planctomycetota bacterium]|jgi:hypothetical protein
MKKFIFTATISNPAVIIGGLAALLFFAFDASVLKKRRLCKIADVRDPVKQGENYYCPYGL